jgi:broad specificity phosphatase PhoE
VGGLSGDPAPASSHCAGVVLTAATLIVWRHGRTAWNRSDRFQGHTDVELDEVGVAQAEAAAVVLAQLGPTVVVSSDLSRAHRTAAALADRCDLGVAIDPRLRETNGGTWEGLTAAEIAAVDGEAFHAWRAGADLPAGGAETRRQVADRARAAVVELSAAQVAAGIGHPVMVVVTHGGTARVLLADLMGLSNDQWPALGGLANACWSVMSGSADPAAPEGWRWRLTEHNAGSLPRPVEGDDR